MTRPDGTCGGCGDAPHPGPCDPDGSLYDAWMDREARQAAVLAAMAA